jgi:hypothetical protein
MDREHVRSSHRIYDDGRIHLVEEREEWREKKMSVLAGSMQNKSLDEDCILFSNNI